MPPSTDRNPVVSVVMPVHNSQATVEASAHSVLTQTHTDLELIVVNDASTDKSMRLLRSLSDADPRVRLIDRLEPGGPAAARNDAIAVARGRFVAFCDADDLWLPDKLSRQLHLAELTGAPLLYGAYHRVSASFSGDSGDVVGSERVVSVPATLTYRDLLKRNQIGCLTAMYDRSQVGDVSMPDIPGAEDWALWLRVLRTGGTARGVQEPIALYRTAQPGSHSARRIRAVKAVWSVLRDEEDLSRGRATLHLVTDAWAAIRKLRI